MNRKKDKTTEYLENLGYVIDEVEEKPSYLKKYDDFLGEIMVPTLIRMTFHLSKGRTYVGVSFVIPAGEKDKDEKIYEIISSILK